MPLPLRGVVLVSERHKGKSIIRLLQRHRCTVEWMDNDVCDFLCGGALVLYIDDMNRLCETTYRGVVSKRISSVKAQIGSSGRSVVLLLIGSLEPRPDVMVWLNLHCSVELHCGVMLCWTEEECASYLEGLAGSGVASVEYRVAGKKESAPVPVLVEAFTQTPQLMTRNDVVRAAHRFGSVAKLLTAAPEEFSNLPGFGPKKAGRLCTVFHACFQTSRQMVSDVLADYDELHRTNTDEGESHRIPAREKMLHALHELRDRELNETFNS
ncbi:DNA repair protein [Trypanosoma grayi]|uniref:DNA repair protein n=1 Tax=Trypanosoma grayi TaxID=71804 RepID=UPI0004F4590C|nr:DNA repair protein [Trypanosoma grayi]KEG10730.1 DNA repair protein [Trypanosoma grayi]